MVRGTHTFILPKKQTDGTCSILKGLTLVKDIQNVENQLYLCYILYIVFLSCVLT